MSFIKETENYIKKVVLSAGYEIDDITLESSSRRELGEFQINIAMGLAKKYNDNPINIAKNIIITALKAVIYVVEFDTKPLNAVWRIKIDIKTINWKTVL